MKALWRYDWEKSGVKMVLVTGFLFLLVACIYGLSIYSHVSPSVLKGGGRHYEVSMEFYDARMLPIWGLPLVLSWLSGRLMSDDKQSGWMKLCGAMPLTARQYVTEKYLIGLAFMGTSMVFVLLCQVVYVVWLGVFDGWFLTLFFLRYMMVFLMVSGVFTVLAYWKGFGFAALCEVLLLVGVPLLAVLTAWVIGSRGGGEFLYRLADIIEWLYYQPTGIVCCSIGSVAVYVLSYILCLSIARRSGT